MELSEIQPDRAGKLHSGTCVGLFYVGLTWAFFVGVCTTLALELLSSGSTSGTRYAPIKVSISCSSSTLVLSASALSGCISAFSVTGGDHTVSFRRMCGESVLLSRFDRRSCLEVGLAEGTRTRKSDSWALDGHIQRNTIPTTVQHSLQIVSK